MQMCCNSVDFTRLGTVRVKCLHMYIITFEISKMSGGGGGNAFVRVGEEGRWRGKCGIWEMGTLWGVIFI